jgi:putative membrane protein
MIIELIISLILGILFGTLTGLIPGIHINLISLILLSISSRFLGFTTPLILSIFIVAMAITHTFVDFIPSIFLGAPDEDSFLSILPGHQFLLRGHGYFAIILTLYGSLTALFIIIITLPLFIYLLPLVYPYLQKIIWIVLILVSIFLINTEKERKIWALTIFILAGFLGIASFNLNIKEPLLPLLTGLFGSSNLIISITNKTQIPKQKIIKLSNITLPKKSLIKNSLASILSAPFTAFLPGLGSSQAALIGQQIFKIKDTREFLFLLGSINTIVMGLSFVTLYSISKTRTGAAVSISQLLPKLNITELYLIIFTMIFSGIIAFFITLIISKFISKNITNINYSKISISILTILFFIVIIFSDYSFYGKILSIIIFLTSTFLGIFTTLLKIKRIHLMGCLIIPTIIFYLI